MMPQSFRLTAVDDILPGEAKEFTVGGRVIALFNVGGDFYALDGVCPHAGGPLGEGTLSGNVVTCPWHGWQFDVTTGRHCLNANIQHTCYPVTIANGDIYVTFPS